MLAAVTDCVTDCRNTATERRFRNDAPLPYCCDKLVFADDVVTIADEILQEVQYLRFDENEVRAPPQFPPFDVKRIILELVDHYGLGPPSQPLTGKNQRNPSKEATLSQSIVYAPVALK